MTQVSVSSLQEDRVTLTWSELFGSEAGNSAVTSYVLYYDNASMTVDFELLD